jgi:hypothetical protein
VSRRAFLSLLLVTLIALGAAIAALWLEPRPQRAPRATIAALPELAEGTGAVAVVEIEGPGGHVLARRNRAGLWEAPEKGGYPLRQGAPEALLSELAALTLVEPKTERPERYPVLGVEAREAASARSRLVNLRDASGDDIASILVGRQAGRPVAGAPDGTYLRRPGQAQSWLASGSLALPSRTMDWIDDNLLHLPPDILQSIALSPAAVPGFVAWRQARGSQAFTLHAEGVEIELSRPASDRLARSFAFLTFEDVAAESEIAFPEAVTRVGAATFDGTLVTLELARIASRPWLRLRAGVVEKPQDRAAAQAFAEDLSARHSHFAYRISEGLYRRLRPELESLLAESAGGSAPQ